MPHRSATFSARAVRSWAERGLVRCLRRLNPSLAAVEMFPAGHFYSPLPDLGELSPTAGELPFDGAEYWENVDLRPEQMRAYYGELLRVLPSPHLSEQPAKGGRYFRQNEFFPFADAFTLSAIIRHEKPRHIVEVGSGFSSAAMVDAITEAGLETRIVCIEPFPERLLSAIPPNEVPFLSVRVQRVQEVPLSIFEELQPQDILFIDSSHVAKIGSDLTFLFLRVLPRLRPGVLIHLHDIFYPFSYPVSWVRAGRAWNESLFLRAMLANSANFQVIAFNPFAGAAFPEVFLEAAPAFLSNTGGSIWLKKLA